MPLMRCRESRQLPSVFLYRYTGAPRLLLTDIVLLRTPEAVWYQLCVLITFSWTHSLRCVCNKPQREVTQPAIDYASVLHPYQRKMQVSGLVPARFLTIIAHLIIVIVIFWSREENIRMCLPERYTDSQYDEKDLQMIIGLSVTLGLFLFEFIGFMGGITMFFPFQSLLSTVAHTGAAVALSYFLFDSWPCDWYWYVFGFCSAFPAFTEIITILGVLFFKKSI